MANIPRKKTTKGAPPPASRPSANLTKDEPGKLKPLNFRVTSDFHRDFKLYATLHDMSMHELLMKCYEEYKDKHPS